MASNNSGVQQQQQQQQQQHFQQPHNTSPHQCKECGVAFNSAESLDVHFQYHKENLLKTWGTSAATPHSEETNNNNTKANNIKREFIPNNIIAAAADSSDSMKKSPDYSRTTPETIFGHPPTPQSYQSASSPYQNHDNSAFSPNFQNYQMKQERSSPNHYQNNYGNFSEPFFGIDANQQYPQEFPMHKNTASQVQNYRFHPYQPQPHSPYERHQSNPQVTSSSPAYPPQPTPSPSPKQCDKCGLVCDSASHLIEHLNNAHPPTPATAHISSYHPGFLFNNEQQVQIKIEDDAQSEILDLDSHKVHQVYPEDEKRQNGDLNGHHPHSVSAMLNTWSPPQQKLFQQQQEQQRMFMNGPQNDQKIFQPHPVHNQEFMGGSVTTTSQENVVVQQNYRPFEHLPSVAANPVISSTQVPNNPPQAPAGGGSGTKSTNWKSNEARRPKTYNCTACNKWFTSSGHLKRHYNTTLHKNAVKSSGQPDPASLPISAHHHPARDSNSNKEDQSNSPGDEDTNSMPPQFERSNSMPGLLQQPPNGPYDRQPAPNIHHPPPLHSPMSHNPNLVNPSNLTNLSNGSPPNGEAGLSPTTNLDSRGLLSLNTPNTTQHHGFNMAPPPPHPMMPIENSQFQMYPNGSAPHVTQVTVTNSPNIIGEYIHQIDAVEDQNHQPLPSFAQFQSHRFGIMMSYGNANVGGGGPATAPYSYYPSDPFETADPRNLMYRNDDDEYRLTVLTPGDPASPIYEEILVPGYTSPNNNNNNNIVKNCQTEDPLLFNGGDETKIAAPAKSPEKAHIKRDFEESITGSPRISSTVQVNLPKQGIHKCIDCDKLFNKACYLTQHNKTFHCGDKPFKCTRCGKRFSSDVTYQEHLSKHAGEKPHKCDLCPKQFNHKTDLRRHMCLHTGQKPFSCDTCGKGFIRKDHMLKHCETHFRKTHNKIAVVR